MVAQARLAPSVHNIQPSRWRIGADRLHLFGDPARAIPVADPQGRDWRLSHGCHFEGLVLALAQDGIQAVEVDLQSADRAPDADGFVAVATCKLAAMIGKTPPREPEAQRVSWRGPFQPVDAGMNRALADLASERADCRVVSGRAEIADIAVLSDRAALHFLRDDAHRAELLQWMRLSRSQPEYHLDGLNAAAMHLSPLAAWGAGLVLGRLFRRLDRIGLAAPLVSEAAKTKAAAAVVLFHRPVGEDPFVSGREFYRAWLAFQRHGLLGCPMSVLADWDVSREQLATRFAVPAGRQIVSVFRLGRPKGTPAGTHARLPVDQLLV